MHLIKYIHITAIHTFIDPATAAIQCNQFTTKKTQQNNREKNAPATIRIQAEANGYIFRCFYFLRVFVCLLICTFSTFFFLDRFVKLCSYSIANTHLLYWICFSLSCVFFFWFLNLLEIVSIFLSSNNHISKCHYVCVHNIQQYGIYCIFTSLWPIVLYWMHQMDASVCDLCAQYQFFLEKCLNSAHGLSNAQWTSKGTKLLTNKRSLSVSFSMRFVSNNKEEIFLKNTRKTK